MSRKRTVGQSEDAAFHECRRQRAKLSNKLGIGIWSERVKQSARAPRFLPLPAASWHPRGPSRCFSSAAAHLSTDVCDGAKLSPRHSCGMKEIKPIQPWSGVLTRLCWSCATRLGAADSCDVWNSVRTEDFQLRRNTEAAGHVTRCWRAARRGLQGRTLHRLLSYSAPQRATSRRPRVMCDWDPLRFGLFVCFFQFVCGGAIPVLAERV